jgi:hypothetical protein
VQKQAPGNLARQRRHLTARPVLLIAVALAILVTFVVARGSTTGSSPQQDIDPRVFAGKFISTGFGVLIGTATPDDVLQLYTPTCVQGANGQKLKQDMVQSRQLVAADKRVKVDGVEFGDGFEVNVTNNGYVVTLPGSKNIRLHVNGEWLTAHDQLQALDIEQSDAGDAVGHLTLEYVQGKLRVASC